MRDGGEGDLVGTLLEAGTNRIAQESKAAGRAMPVIASGGYDVFSEQASGSKTLRKGLMLTPGEVTEVR
ncbi:hypothetical protein OJF2_60620 [Aquisphaera giovannonii]|uniref:Uncharacterized protein n=2 Tax=Aquisphaera giovannonii TaxID=406548 RepID=A0A5B9WBT5_9BACT|nr:hypothetical protein OJF2_60620 [Aquisphaera giovannonii]